MNLMSSFKSFMRFEELSTYYSVSSNFLCSHIEQKYPHFLHMYQAFPLFDYFFFLALIHVVTTFNITLNFVCTVVNDFKSKEGTKTNLAISHIKLPMMKSSP